MSELGSAGWGRCVPASVNSAARSRTSTCQPRWASATADASPPIPPPMMIAFMFASPFGHLIAPSCARLNVVEAGRAHVGQAVELVDALVVADLPQQVSKRAVAAVFGGVAAGVGLGLQLGVLAEVGHVLVLGVVLEVGVEPVAPFRPEHQQQPGHVIVEER